MDKAIVLLGTQNECHAHIGLCNGLQNLRLSAALDNLWCQYIKLPCQTQYSLPDILNIMSVNYFPISLIFAETKTKIEAASVTILEISIPAYILEKNLLQARIHPQQFPEPAAMSYTLHQSPWRAILLGPLTPTYSLSD